MSCQNLLRDWGFEQYIDVFESEEIDLEALLDLSEFSLCQLIPKAGPRTKMMKRIAEYKAASSKLTEEQKTVAEFDKDLQDLGIIGNHYDRVFKISIPSDDEFNASSVDAAETSNFFRVDMSLVKPEPEEEVSVVKVEPEDEEMSIVNEETEDEQVPTFQDLETKQNPTILEPSFRLPKSGNIYVKEVHQKKNLKFILPARKVIDDLLVADIDIEKDLVSDKILNRVPDEVANNDEISNPMLREMIKYAVPIENKIDSTKDNIVREYLNCAKGQMINANYFGINENLKPPEKQYLDETHQNMLVELIINNELKTTTTEISTPRLMELSKNIEQIFPNEKQGIYYIPYSSVRVGGKVVKKNSAKGKLWFKYTNICRTLRRDGVRGSKRKNDVSLADEGTTPETINELLLGLTGQTEISENVKKRWNETSKHRLDLLLADKIRCETSIKRSGKCLINNYFLKYPFLKQPDGYLLLEEDFLAKYPGSGNKLFDNWPKFKEKVIKLSMTSQKTAPSDGYILVEFCNIVTSVQKCKRITKTWYANAEEIKEGFILHIKSVERALLIRANDAKIILANYPKTKGKGKRCEKNYIGLKSVHRNLLCDIIIQEELKNVNYQITSDRFKLISNEIVQLFPKEKASMYYIPHLCIKKNNKIIATRSAKGKLYHKYTNFRKKLRQGGLLLDKNSTCHVDDDNSGTLIAIDYENPNFSVTQSARDALLWLDGRTEICERVPKEWDISRNARVQELRNEIDQNNKDYLNDYFHKKYPFLKQPRGYTLLQEDFNNLYPASKNALFNEWVNFSSRVKLLAGINSNTQVSDAQIILLLGKLFEDEGLSSIPVNKKFRARKADMLQSFLFQAQNAHHLLPGIEALRTKAQIDPTTVQPYAAVVGNDAGTFDSYCVIAGVQYKLSSVLEAIDIAFKSFHALHTVYPRASECYWMLLQRAVYKLSTPWDKTIQISQVDVLMDKLYN